MQIDRDADLEKGEYFFVHNRNYTSPSVDLHIEGDWSAAGAFLVLSALTGSSIDYSNLNLHRRKAIAHSSTV